jgi:hypothetical protein
MWKKTPEDLLGLKHMELLPLLPLMQGGNKQEAVELMFTQLASDHGIFVCSTRFSSIKAL